MCKPCWRILLFTLLIVNESEPTATPPSSFLYQVLVVDETHEPISNARVQLRFNDILPETKFTDDNGIAVFHLDARYILVNVERVIMAQGYDNSLENITLQKISHTVVLTQELLEITPSLSQITESIPQVTETPTSTSTPIDIAPTKTATSTSTSTPTSINIPTLTPVPPTATLYPYVPTLNPQLGNRWIRPRDNMIMLYVPAGSFMMGSEYGDEDEEPIHQVTLSAFWVDETEITNAQFAKFLNDGTRLNFCDTNCPFDGRDNSFDDGYAYTSPVGSFPSGMSWVNALDVTGNVSEWTATWYFAYDNTHKFDPIDTILGERRVVRGGSYGPESIRPHTINRSSNEPIESYDRLGFRCVMPES